MKMLKDKHVVITGGGSGIGASISEILAKSGAKTTIMGRNYKRLQEKTENLHLCVLFALACRFLYIIGLFVRSYHVVYK